MHPGQEFSGFVDHFQSYKERKQPLDFHTQVNYRLVNSGKQQNTLEYHLDIWSDLPTFRKT